MKEYLVKDLETGRYWNTFDKNERNIVCEIPEGATFATGKDPCDLIFRKNNYYWCVESGCDSYWVDTYVTLDSINRHSDIELAWVRQEVFTDESKDIFGVVSDGGSSDYYFTKLPKHMIDQIVLSGGIEIKDIVRYCFSNDSDCKDIIKALKRIDGFKNGCGKHGVNPSYDANKILFFANELKKSIDNGDLNNE